MAMRQHRWKFQADSFNDNDNVSGVGDQNESFMDCSLPGLTGSPIDVKFIRKDETNFEVARRMGVKIW